MWPFKKKKKDEPLIDSKYHLNDVVSFWYKTDLKLGFIRGVYQNEDGKVLYDIQFGGECPAFLKNVSENNIVERVK